MQFRCDFFKTAVIVVTNCNGLAPLIHLFTCLQISTYKLFSNLFGTVTLKANLNFARLIDVDFINVGILGSQQKNFRPLLKKRLIWAHYLVSDLLRGRSYFCYICYLSSYNDCV